jgi:hypothetical protein
MPTHLERVHINADSDLEKWEANQETEYSASKALGLETCKAKGQDAALRKVRENIVNAQFPKASIHLFLRS